MTDAETPTAGTADGLPTPGSLADANEAASDSTPSFRENVRARPRLAAAWVAGALGLLALEAGAVFHFGITLLPVSTIDAALPAFPGEPAVTQLGRMLADVPTLLSRETIPNQGYRIPGHGWESTFLELSPAAAWFLRVALTFAYAACWFAWGWVGYRWYRSTYRVADWTPMDDAIDRFRTHRWGQFGLVVVAVFLVLAVFAPTLGPTTVERNMEEPFSHELTYYDESTDSLETILVGTANLETISQGTARRNVGPLSYDAFGRYHPFGTLPSGRDLFTFMAAGARVSLFIGLLAVGLGTVIAVSLALVASYYRGTVDLAVVLLADSIQALPQLLVLILVSVAFAGSWIANLYHGGVLIALVFAGTGWPALWRAIRGPALQVTTEDWVEAARGFGQAPAATMRRHVLPYVLGYVLVYASMILGGVIIGVAGLSFLGLGVSAPTPEWGRAISEGEPYLASVSWHISLIPGLMFVLVVTGFNALGDGIRDAIDPQADHRDAEATAASGGGA